MAQWDLGRLHPNRRDKMVVIHNGVDQTRFTWSDKPQSAVRARLGWREDGGAHAACWEWATEGDDDGCLDTCTPSNSISRINGDVAHTVHRWI